MVSLDNLVLNWCSHTIIFPILLVQCDLICISMTCVVNFYFLDTIDLHWNTQKCEHYSEISE